MIYPAPDLAPAKEWYTSILGFDPYFDQPYYVGFSVGGYELGLDPNAPVGTGVPSGPVVYWGVENAETAMEMMGKAGAGVVSPVTDVGEGIKVAQVRDPFGNVFGIVENPNFKLP